MRIFRHLYIQVLLGILAAIILGISAPDIAVKMKPLGDGFIALLRMMLAPIIFSTVVLGLTQVAGMRQLGRLALKALIYFEVATTLAMILGFVAVNIFQPGSGLHAANLEVTENVARATSSATQFTAVRFFLSIIPTTLVDAFAKGEILQVLFISVLVGVALSMGGVRQDSVVIRVITEGQEILFRILGFLMRLAPLGAFGALSAAIGNFGAETLFHLAKLVALAWGTSLFFVVVCMGLMAALVGLSIFKIIQLIRDELLICLGTASGEVVLPRMLRKLEEAGCDKSVVGFVLPAGYSFNLDGTSIYMAVCAGFIAQATDTPFSIAEQIAMLGVMLLTSKGGSTVAGGAFVKLAATMQTVPTLPMGGLGLIFGVDRLLATALSMTNLVGNALAVFVVAKWEGAFSKEKFDLYLERQSAGLIDASGAEKQTVAS
ncbi:MAG: cation:dicarboxylase symporter family transporter [Rhodospirillaceae bacterium]